MGHSEASNQLSSLVFSVYTPTSGGDPDIRLGGGGLGATSRGGSMAFGYRPLGENYDSQYLKCISLLEGEMSIA